tara:strand:- start:264 stop:1010 length:747 start_codon:yes stop_codon:yes gene_type:complete
MRDIKGVVVFGATSSIATAVLKYYATRSYEMFLVGRDRHKLQKIADDMLTIGAKTVYTDSMDFTKHDDFTAVVNKAFCKLTNVDVVLVAHGTLPENNLLQAKSSETWDQIKINVVSTISILNEVASKLERQDEGTIAVITSVAGDRLRASNYFYGAMKKMISVYLDNLRMKFHMTGINVIDLKPGPVDTPMNNRVKSGFLCSKPEDVAKDVVEAIDSGVKEKYIPGRWKWIMIIIKLIPNPIFRKLRI